MIGALIGDIVGSRFEWHNRKSKDFELFDRRCRPTDDSIMSLAVARAILNSSEDYEDLPQKAITSMQELGRLYPDAGYGGSFGKWIASDDPQPYNSYGNGSAMRVSPCGYAATSLEEAKRLSALVTEVSHNHPEGMKGAEAIAVAIFLAKEGKSKEEIKKHMWENYYDINFTIDEIRDTYEFDVSCQGSVPVALAAFFESTDFEDAIRNAISVGGDSDTIAAIAGSVAEAFYGVPQYLVTSAISYLDERQLDILRQFEQKYPSKVFSSTYKEDKKKPRQHSELGLTALDFAGTKDVLAQLIALFGIPEKLKQSLSKETMFVLDIPKEILQGLKTGDYTFMQKKDSGKKLAAIYKVEDGKKHLFANLTAKEVQVSNEKALVDLNQSFQQLALQQQMATLLNKIEDMCGVIERIEQGQRDDRLAEVESGYSQLRQALRIVDEEKRNRRIEQAIQTTNTASEKIKKELKRKIEEFEPVPSDDKSIYWKMFKSHSSYIDKKDEEYDDIAECFEYYETAVKLLVCANLMEGEPDVVEEVLCQHGAFIKSLEIANLKTIANLHPEESFEDEWYVNPENYIEKTRQGCGKFVEGNYDCFSIEATGTQFLEVLENEETK